MSESGCVSANLPVAVDVMGGDLGPSVVIQGAVLAARNHGAYCLLVGDENAIRAELKRLGVSDSSHLSIAHAPQEIGMHESPRAVLRAKSEASVRVSFELVKEKRASAVVSTGNTGAVMAAGLHVCGTMPGVARPAIACVIPRRGTNTPAVLVDSGANTECRAFQLVQFALMGHLYSALALGIEKPRIGVLANGTEPSKGTDMLREVHRRLSSLESINFIGYVEGNSITKGDGADVVVCDGLTGNIVLKTVEGMAGLSSSVIKTAAKRSLKARLGFWLAESEYRKVFSDLLDPANYGGAPLLGLNCPAIICHGASGPRAVMNAVTLAARVVAQELVPKLSSALEDFEEELT